nr:MAG TPA: hypothetical protein [Bacteriophage sp.]
MASGLPHNNRGAIQAPLPLLRSSSSDKIDSHTTLSSR